MTVMMNKTECLLYTITVYTGRPVSPVNIRTMKKALWWVQKGRKRLSMRSGVRKVKEKDTGETHILKIVREPSLPFWRVHLKYRISLTCQCAHLELKAQVFPHFHCEIHWNFLMILRTMLKEPLKKWEWVITQSSTFFTNGKFLAVSIKRKLTSNLLRSSEVS